MRFETIPPRCLLFLVTNGNLTLLFFICVQIVRTRCLLLLVINGNLTLLFFIWDKLNLIDFQCVRGVFLLHVYPKAEIYLDFSTKNAGFVFAVEICDFSVFVYNFYSFN